MLALKPVPVIYAHGSTFRALKTNCINCFPIQCFTLLNNSFLIRNAILLIWLRNSSAIQGKEFNLVEGPPNNLKQLKAFTVNVQNVSQSLQQVCLSLISLQEPSPWVELISSLFSKLCEQLSTLKLMRACVSSSFFPH